MPWSQRARPHRAATTGRSRRTRQRIARRLRPPGRRSRSAAPVRQLGSPSVSPQRPRASRRAATLAERRAQRPRPPRDLALALVPPPRRRALADGVRLPDEPTTSGRVDLCAAGRIPAPGRHARRRRSRGRDVHLVRLARSTRRALAERPVRRAGPPEACARELRGRRGPVPRDDPAARPARPETHGERRDRRRRLRARRLVRRREHRAHRRRRRRDGAGAAWTFGRSGRAWSQLGSKLTRHGKVRPDLVRQSGGALGGRRHGGIAGTGDDGVGATWIFTRTGPGWTQTAKLTPNDASGPRRSACGSRCRRRSHLARRR